VDEFELSLQDGELDEHVLLLTLQVCLPIRERPREILRRWRDEDRVLDVGVPADEVLDIPDAPRLPERRIRCRSQTRVVSSRRVLRASTAVFSASR